MATVSTRETLPTPDDVARAAERVRGEVHRTPVLTCSTLDRLTGCRLFFKCENLQKVGAFKFRGATNAVRALGDEAAARGVTTHSSGNHAAALALAARRRGIPAHVVMPSTAPAAKRAAVEGYGATVTTCEPTLAARERALAEVVARTGAHFVHPYNDREVIAGQGTAALELLEEVPELEAVLTPLGGGGLLSGTALAVALSRRPVIVVGAEPTVADDARRSLERGEIVPSGDPPTIADGLRTCLGSLTFALLQRYAVRVLTASEATIVGATRLLLERAKLVVEPSGAVPLAALLEHSGDLRGRRIGIVLSGGNLDLDHLPWS